MRILLAGGGTGGHVYPALAIGEGLRKAYPTARFLYVGTRQGVEAKALRSYPWIRFSPILAAGWTRGSWIRMWLAAIKLALGLVQSVGLFLWFRPQLVIGVGGYASFAPLIVGAVAGRVFPVRTVIHEQNVVGGRANRWLSRFVDLVMLSFPQSERSFPRARRVVVTGNPVREEFLHVRRSDELYRSFGLDPARRTILVYGGSKGAREITDQILSGRRQIAETRDLQILLIVGDPERAATIRAILEAEGIENVVVKGYVHQMGSAFAVADLVVCRAGATSLAEITACGKASVLVPWQKAAEDHQRRNAEALRGEQACAMADEGVLVSQGLVRVVLQQIRDELGLSHLALNARRLGQRDAESRILGEIRGLVREGES
jgi:UDP-N-acetylglucosamine--N-acetylmuramyl-(pentapeptide) pyrophosphoryl-undecaprenol N-acetylglucosamine transferase